MTKTSSCEDCGEEQRHKEYVAVGPSTPVARQLNLREPTTDSHHVLCERCFSTAVSNIQDTNTEAQ